MIEPAAIRIEIERLHEFFVSWFSGEEANDRGEFDRQVTSRLADEFALVQPNGRLLSRADIADAVYSGHGSNPTFRIAIRNFDVRVQGNDLTLVTYEEWQRNALNSTPPDNGRLSTAAFRLTPSGLEWVHVHETWLPEPVMDAGPYDF